jgi:hypothetical protein
MSQVQFSEVLINENSSISVFLTLTTSASQVSRAWQGRTALVLSALSGNLTVKGQVFKLKCGILSLFNQVDGRSTMNYDLVFEAKGREIHGRGEKTVSRKNLWSSSTTAAFTFDGVLISRVTLRLSPLAFVRLLGSFRIHRGCKAFIYFLRYFVVGLMSSRYRDPTNLSEWRISDPP